jgi:hypothetical protein
VYDPISVESVEPGQKFLAWSTYYNNGVIKQNGGWTLDGEKQGVWQYHDSSSGRVTYKNAYEHGIILVLNFKFTWEKYVETLP